MLLTDHAVRLFFDFRCGRTLRNGLRAVEANKLDPSDELGLVHAARRDATGPWRLVFEDSDLTIAADLHPAAITALGGTADRRIPCLRLADVGRAVANGDWARPPGDPRQSTLYRRDRGITIPLGTDAQARLHAAGTEATDEIRFAVQDLRVIALSGNLDLAILDVALTSKVVTLALLQEALHTLGHGNRKQLVWACEAEPSHHFNLTDLVRTLLAPADSQIEAWNRIYTVVFAQVAELPPEHGAVHAVWRLSRHFTNAYAPGADFLAGTGMLRGFADVLHAAGIEGVATLAEAKTSFLATGLRDRIDTAYLPLAVLAYHEHVALLELAQNAPAQDSKGMRRLLDRFLRLRLSLRLPVVSDITAHNEFYAILRRGLQIDALTRKVAEDATEADRQLAARERDAEARARANAESLHRRRERMLAPIVALFAALLTFLTSLTAMKEILPEIDYLREQMPKMPLLVALGLGLLSFCLTYFRHRSANRDRSEGAPEATVDDEMAQDLMAESVMAGAEQMARTPRPD